MTGLDPYSDPERTKQQEKRRLKKENEIADLRKVLATEEGQRVLMRIIVDKSKFFDASWTGNSTTFYNEGMREVGRQVLVDIKEAAPDKIGKFFEQALKKDIE